MIRPDQRADAGGVNVGESVHGDVTIGYTIEQHEAALERREARVRADLERAFEAEKALLQQQLEEVRRHMANLEGSFATRRGELEASQAAVVALSGMPDSRIEAAYQALGNGETEAADALFRQVQEMGTPTIERVAKAAFERGKLAEADIRWTDAATHYATAARLAPRYEHLLKAREYVFRAGDRAGALQLGDQLVAVALAEYGAGSPERATALNEHATTLWALQRYDEAERLYREALEIDQRTVGKMHACYAERLGNLATLLSDTFRYGEAEALYREALTIDEKTCGKAHPDYAVDLRNLATLLRETDRRAEAGPLFREALAIDEKALGRGHPSFAIDLGHVAGLLRDADRLDEAEDLYREALAIDGRIFGAGHPDYANDLCDLAALLADRGCREEAEARYREALAIFGRALGTAHPDYATCLGSLAHLLTAMGRPEEAESLYRQALAIDGSTVGGTPPDHATRLNDLGTLLESEDRAEEAAPLYRKALAMFAARLGAEHSSTRIVAGNLARVEEALAGSAGPVRPRILH